MHRILLSLILLGCIASADTAFVNTAMYEDRIINLCDENLTCTTNVYRFIDIKGYGLLHVALAGGCTSKLMFGIYQNVKTCGLAIDPSLNLLYDTLEEEWEIDYLPSGLVQVPDGSGPFTNVICPFEGTVHHPIVGTLSFNNPVIDRAILLLPFYESGKWGQDMMMTSDWMNTFGNIGEVFYISHYGENTIKFQILECTQYPVPRYILRFASDSLGNGKFKINTTPVIAKDPDFLQPTRPTLRFINNKLCIPQSLKSGRISIFNICGQKMFTQTLQGNHVALPNLPCGFYQYSVTGSSGSYRGTFLNLD